MANASGRLQVTVVTPERAVLDEPADAAVLPMYDGELGVLPGRAPLIGRLGPGELRLTAGGAVRRYFVDGGFAQVTAAGGKTVVTVLTPRAQPAAEVTAAVAAEAAAAADALPAGTPAEREGRQRAQERARGLSRLATKEG